jgi:peroxiredoxin
MEDSPHLAVGDRVAEMPFATANGGPRWTSELTAGGACVLVVLDHASSPEARLQVRGFDALADAFERRGVSIAALSPDEPATQRALRRAEHCAHVTFLADPTGQVCGALGVLNGVGAHRTAFVIDANATVRAVIDHASPDGQAAAALDVIEHLWPEAARQSA